MAGDKADKPDKAEASAKELPKARVVDRDAQERRRDPLRAIRIGGFLAALVLGWLFILYVNKFDPTPPVVFVGLAYLALLSAIYAMWRTGVVVADENEDDADSTWERPLGARSELEREKKSLLKAIKETEFDREMGKLSPADAERMITVYRARAIEVIKELDKPVHGEGSVREQIAREVKARLELEEKTRATEVEAKAAKKKKNQAKQDRKPAKSAKASDASAKASASASESASESESESAKTPAPASESAKASDMSESAKASDASESESASESAKASDAAETAESASAPAEAPSEAHAPEAKESVNAQSEGAAS